MLGLLHLSLAAAVSIPSTRMYCPAPVESSGMLLVEPLDDSEDEPNDVGMCLKSDGTKAPCT